MAVRPSANSPMASDDPIGFEELWEHREQVRAVCLGIVKDPVEVDDLVQDTYVRALTTAHPPDRRGPVGPWLAVVARHRALDKLRSERDVDCDPVVERTASTIEGPVDHVLRTERQDRVRRALAELDDRDRRLLVQHVVQGLSVSEVAVREQVTEASVRSHLWRARQRLRVAVERGGPLGVAPTERLAGPLRRLRALYSRVEGNAPAMAFGAAAYLVEAAATAVVATVLFLMSLSSPAGEVGGALPPRDGTRWSTPAPVPVSVKPPAVRVDTKLRVADLATNRLRPDVRARFAVGTDVGPWKSQVGLDSTSDGRVTDIKVSVGLRLSTPLVTVPEKEVTLRWSCGSPEEDRVSLPAGYSVDGCPPFKEVMDVVDSLHRP